MELHSRMTFVPTEQGTKLSVSSSLTFGPLSTYAKLMMPFMYGFYKRALRNGSIRNLNNIARLLDGPSTRREIRAFAAKAWSWWIVFAGAFLAVLVLYNEHNQLHMSPAWTHALETLLIVMGVIGVMAFRIFSMMRRSFAKWN